MPSSFRSEDYNQGRHGIESPDMSHEVREEKLQLIKSEVIL